MRRVRRVLRNGVEIYRIRSGSLREFFADLPREVRSQGLGRGGLRALFRAWSEWAYLMGAYPKGGWEFVDFLVHEADSCSKGLDRWLLQSAFVKGIQHRAAFVREELRRQLSRRLRVRGPERIIILDVGCGIGTFGFYALECAQEFGQDGRVRVIGIDRDPRAVALAQRLTQARGFDSHIRWECVDAFRHLERTDERYDLVLCIGVLAYLPDLQAIELLSAIHARLRDGGVLVASHLHPRISRAMHAWLRLMGVNLRARRPEELEKLLRTAGFSRLRMTQDATGTQNFMVAEASPTPLPSADGSGRVLGRIVWVEADRLLDHEEVEPARVEKLAQVLRQRGRVPPILVERHHRVVLDGHHRKAALQALGLRKIPCCLVPYDRIGLSSRRGLSVRKEEVIQRALTGQKFPPKTTRHLYAFHELPEVELPLCPERSPSRSRGDLPAPPERTVTVKDRS